ncbi:gas vesicle protein [Streptosporangium amethystogenes subsp. fukuiense]|uniref:Gas vesicle protein n=1 Tax=Streptosporangium amethystogenes subsp. fukuiense TaxID=698418 RepID=A0ABW2SSJ3_9ACTN
MAEVGRSGTLPRAYGGGLASNGGPANLADILERVLDRGIVIVGDIRVNLLDIELLTIKLRLLIASVDTARELGIDWWEHDPWVTAQDRDLVAENRRLRRQLAAAGEGGPDEREERSPRKVKESRGARGPREYSEPDRLRKRERDG